MGIPVKKGPAKWLLDELPFLQGAGLIDAVSAANLQAHYSRLIMTAPSRSRSLAMLMLSVLGSLLIGAGVITLLAHNWDELPKWLRLAVAFLPLIVVQIIGGWSLLKDKSLAWRESVGIFTPLAVMAVISIVAQVYNISGDPVKFYFTLCLLSLPVVYIYRSTMAALLCMAGICALGAYSFEHHHRFGVSLWQYWTCVILLLPFIVFMFRKHGETLRSIWLAIGCVVLLIWECCFALDKFNALDMPIFAMAASMIWLLGGSADKNRWAMAFKCAAIPAMLIIFPVSGFEGVWRSFGKTYSNSPTFMQLPVWWYCFTGFLFLANAVLLLQAVRKKDWLTFLPGTTGVALLANITICNTGFGTYEAAAFVASFMGFFGGVAVMLLAIRHEKVLEMNFGMLLAAMVLIFRFFDGNFSFTVKGVIFIFIGAMFLIINLSMVRRFRRALK